MIIIFMGLYYIYENNLYESQQIVRDIKKEVYIPDNNSYVKENINFNFVKMTSDFTPENKQDIINIYYTILNSGWDEFIFYCTYNGCIEDVNNLSGDNSIITNLNNFVTPFNQFKSISSTTTPHLNGKVTIKIEKTYNSDFINLINKEIDKIYNELSLEGKNAKDQIKLIHDYIINNTKYDNIKAIDINDNTYYSENAFGPLFEGYAICSGYADLMSLFLEKFNIPNMRVPSEKHVWNLVYLDNKWLHLDLTWDDPYSEDGIDYLYYTYFLIDYDKLQKVKTSEHNFDESIYIEALQK